MSGGSPSDPGNGTNRMPPPWLGLPLGVLLLVLLWTLVARRVNAPYILPAPSAVLASLIAQRALIAHHTIATLIVVLTGFGLGFALATVLGYFIAHFPLLERLLMPLIVAMQAVPIIAVAPLLVYVLGSGTPVKVAVSTLIVFFPMLVNTVTGLRNIDRSYRDLMHILSATRWQTLRLLEIPAALPVLLAGLRVGVTLSVIGAVVGEFLAPDQGLGALVTRARGAYNDPLVFAALLVLVLLAVGLYGLAALSERLVLRNR